MAKRKENLNCAQLIVELRKPGKCYINMSGTELQIAIEKSDFIAVLGPMVEMNNSCTWDIVEMGDNYRFISCNDY